MVFTCDADQHERFCSQGRCRGLGLARLESAKRVALIAQAPKKDRCGPSGAAADIGNIKDALST